MLAISYSLQMYWSSIAHDRALRVHDEQREALNAMRPGGWKSRDQSEADDRCDWELSSGTEIRNEGISSYYVFYDFENGKTLTIKDCKTSYSPAISVDADIFAIPCNNGRIRLWNKKAEELA